MPVRVDDIERRRGYRMLRQNLDKIAAREIVSHIKKRFQHNPHPCQRHGMSGLSVIAYGAGGDTYRLFIVETPLGHRPCSDQYAIMAAEIRKALRLAPVLQIVRRGAQYASVGGQDPCRRCDPTGSDFTCSTADARGAPLRSVIRRPFHRIAVNLAGVFFVAHIEGNNGAVEPGLADRG